MFSYEGNAEVMQMMSEGQVALSVYDKRYVTRSRIG